MIELNVSDDDYIAYGSNNPEFLLRVITQIANRSDSVLDSYLACAPYMCEYSGSIATRLFLVDGSKMTMPSNSFYCAPSIDPELHRYLIGSNPTQTLSDLSVHSIENENVKSWLIVAERSSLLTAYGINDVLWGIVAFGNKIQAAIEFFRLDGSGDNDRALARVDTVVAELYPVANRECGFARSSGEPQRDEVINGTNLGAVVAFDYSGKTQLGSSVVEKIFGHDNPREDTVANADSVAAALHDITNFSIAITSSSDFISETLQYSRSSGFVDQATAILNNRDSIAAYVTEDPQGKLILPYMVEAAKSLEKELVAIRHAAKIISGCAIDIQETVEHTRNQAFPNISLETVDLGHLCDLAVKINSSAGRGIAIEQHCRYGTMVRTNKTKLMRVLNHLILNAQESVKQRTRVDGMIKISTGELRQNRVRLTIRDNGVGISLVNLHRIFEFGFTTKQNGYGYGLHAAAAILEEIGGDIEAFSDGPGLGAEFRITIPVTPEDLS